MIDYIMAFSGKTVASNRLFKLSVPRSSDFQTIIKPRVYTIYITSASNAYQTLLQLDKAFLDP